MDTEMNSKIKYLHADQQLDKNHAHKFNDGKKKSLSNHEIFKTLGLSKMKTPPGHHRKRLAVESRHHRPDDSHMFVIKLPPNPYYYGSTNTAHVKNGIEEKSNKISSLGFQSNGKPGHIYHWNLPVLKKMLTKNDRRKSNLRLSNNVNELIDIKNIPTWSNPWENETIEKAFGKIDDETKSYKKKSPSYYAPAAAKVNGNTKKYFPGNGKPKSFYVLKKNHHKPHYQKLIP